jgi:ribonucleotide reductase alpha subunit
MKIYSREEALKKSIEYFQGDELAAEVFVTKYAMRNDKLELVEATPDQMHHRLAKEFARIEKKYPNPMSEEEIFGLFDRFKWIVPQGSPMFGIGNPHQTVSISNCFVIDVVDSYGGICRADERIAQISKRRGGCGNDLSPLRPRGMPTKNSALTTDGIIVFAERFSNTAREVAQSGRRGALMESLSVHHPEVLNFIRAKLDLKKITGANISIRISDEFMDAVKKDKTYEQRWPVDSDKPVISNKVNAREVWNEIIKCAHRSGEPGILYWNAMTEFSPADSYSDVGFKTISVNPCVTGDTLVYTADGSGNVPIKKLAEEGKDIPVFCYDDKNKITIKTMRNPRITGYKQPIYKIILDDGSIIRCTGNHKIRLKDETYKQAKDLVSGDSLKIITRFEASIKDVFGESSPSTDYYWVNNGFSANVAEHRIIASCFYHKDITKKFIVHHLDSNGKNNNPQNLSIMSKINHDKLHRERMLGANNPMVRGQYEWGKEKWEEYGKNMSMAVSGEKNGRYLGVTNEELEEKAIKFTKQLGRRFSTEEWEVYAKKNNLPIAFSKWRKDYFNGVSGLSKVAAKKCGYDHINEDPRVVKTLQNMIAQNYNSKIYNGEVIVEKTCGGCGEKFWVDHLRREASFCNLQCSAKNYKMTDIGRQKIKDACEKRSEGIKNKQCNIYISLKSKLLRTPFRKEWESECKENNIPFRLGAKYTFRGYKDLKEQSQYYNHRVVSVVLDGYEDVYNGTVDDFHNFFIGGFESKTKNDKHKWVYVNTLNCGELGLGKDQNCILLLQNLASYIINPFMPDAKLDKELLVKNTRIAQKLIDDMIDLEIESVEKIIKKIKNDPEPEEIKANELNLWESVIDTTTKGRRTGLGITGLGDCIAMLNIKYGSEESQKIVKEIFSIIRDEAYRSSIEMAKDRGAFPVWDHKKEQDNKYLNRLPEDILKEMKKHGRRNIACLTVSPAGSVSILTQTTSGFEPVIMAEYIRKRKLTDNDKDKPDFIDDSGDKWKEYKIEHNGLKLFKKITGKEFKDSPYFKSQANEIDFDARVKMQAIAQKYIDHSISSTINLPNETSIKTVDKIYMSAWEQGCKGLTVYRDGSRDGVLTKDASQNTRECEDCDEAGQKLKELVQQGGRPTKIILSPAPKRHEIMPCEIHRSKVGKGDWIFFVGMLNGQPYEVFGGNSNRFTIPFKYKDGWIQKNGKNKSGFTQYHLVLGSLEDKNEKLEFKDINKHFNNREYGAFTRLVSLSMRHGTPIKYICEQITKTGCAGDLFSFQRAMSRILKKYIADGEKSETECPVCKSSDVIYKNGCPTCKVCGNSNCS